MAAWLQVAKAGSLSIICYCSTGVHMVEYVQLLATSTLRN